MTRRLEARFTPLGSTHGAQPASPALQPPVPRKISGTQVKRPPPLPLPVLTVPETDEDDDEGSGSWIAAVRAAREQAHAQSASLIPTARKGPPPPPVRPHKVPTVPPVQPIAPEQKMTAPTAPAMNAPSLAATFDAADHEFWDQRPSLMYGNRPSLPRVSVLPVRKPSLLRSVMAKFLFLMIFGAVLALLVQVLSTMYNADAFGTRTFLRTWVL